MFYRGREYVSRLVDSFGLSFCTLLCSVYFGLKGPVYTMMVSSQLPYFKGQRFQSFGTVASTPWAMKALIGITSDSVPIFGYHKRPYMLISSFLGCVALGILAAVQMTEATAPIAAVLYMFVSLQLATVDLLTEGTYAALMAAMPDTGADVVTFVWGLYMVGSFIGSAAAGPISDHLNPRVIFYVCLPLALQVMPMSAWLPENQLPRGQRGFRRDKVDAHPRIFLLGVLMTASAVLLAYVSLFHGPEAQSSVSVALSGVLCVLATAWLPKVLGRGNLYMFLASAMYLNIGGASDYWFTADETCVPNGPHFSFTYYITYASLVGAVAGMVGVTLFQMFLSRGTYRMAFLSTLLLKLLASLFDLFLVRRDNLRFGIPDKVAFMLGDAIIYNVAAMLDFMPAVVLTSASCPKGMEATVYSLLAGFQNFGSNVARAIGVGLIDQLKIKTTTPCNFDNLPLAILLSHVLLPLLTIPLIFVLIPPHTMTERLPVDDETGAYASAPPDDPDAAADEEAVLGYDAPDKPPPAHAADEPPERDALLIPRSAARDIDNDAADADWSAPSSPGSPATGGDAGPAPRRPRGDEGSPFTPAPR